MPTLHLLCVSACPHVSRECGLPLSEHSLVHLLLLLLQDTRFERLRSHLGMMMAGEHMAANNLSSARKLLLQVAQAYRR